MQDGVMVGDFIICLLAFFNIFYLFFFLKKKRDPERGPEGGPKRVQKGGPEGRVHVLSTPQIFIVLNLFNEWMILHFCFEVALNTYLKPYKLGILRKHLKVDNLASQKTQATNNASFRIVMHQGCRTH